MCQSPVETVRAATASFDWDAWARPESAYSHCPFWFWNDTLEEGEILRQISEFRAHGVEAFVIHPRIGLPRSCGWLSSELFRFMRLALEEARRLGMWVLLYDEGMYPSGSASGMVVAENPEFKARGLVCHAAGSLREDGIAAGALRLPLAGGGGVIIYDRPVKATLRGLHYIDNPASPDSPLEEEPEAADLLNPAAVRCFMRLVYDRFYAELGDFFCNTVKGIFTDEANPLSRLGEPDIMPGTLSALPAISRFLGYDFTPHLPALWVDSEPEAEGRRRDYRRAIAALMDETYYRPLSEWCGRHGVALCGHPAEPDDIGNLRAMQIPGQDIVWRQIMPGTPSALEGAPSTMAKAAASVKYHLSRARNLNEFAGAYGEELTFRELRWLASWLLIRGCDMLVPHAFYYSVRGRRRHERPPNVGAGSPWWGADYIRWEAMTRRLCWLNASCLPVCKTAILGSPTRLPWQAAKVCFENQIDFHYVEPADLQSAIVKDGCLHIGPACYELLIVEDGYAAEAACIPQGTPVLHWDGGHRLHDLLATVSSTVRLDTPAAGLRARLLKAVPDCPAGVSPASAAHQPVAGEGDILLLFNESEDAISTRAFLNGLRLDPESGSIVETVTGGVCELQLPPHGWAVFVLSK